MNYPRYDTTLTFSEFEVALKGADSEMIARELLERCVGLDVTNPQEAHTPERFIKALQELTTRTPFEFTTFDCPSGLDEMIIERDIPFHSLCRHHVLPFVGVAHVGYIPAKLMPGLSKIARTVQYFAHALQTQEELTADIASSLVDNLTSSEPLADYDFGSGYKITDPEIAAKYEDRVRPVPPVGVAVVLEAEHMCMTLRGVLAPGTRTYTASMYGVFANHEKTAKAEFLNRISK